MSKTHPPRSDELELSLFGPGIGECVVVHLGAGRWMVVDSCLDEQAQPVALAYLDALGVDVASQVELIVVSHWHDDHIRGIARLVRTASSARFACSAALRCEEFMALVVAARHAMLIEQSSGTSELAEVFDILEHRNGSGRTNGPDHWALEGTRLYTRASPPAVDVHVLSPSSQTVTDAKQQLTKLMPKSGVPTRRIPSIEPNETSVVILVQTAGVHLLLGGDLERGADQRRGWKGVLWSPLRPQLRSTTYKVAHHGSDDADIDGIWTDLLVDRPNALLTPYLRGARPRPSEDDVARILRRTLEACCTVRSSGRPDPRRPAAVERVLRQTMRTRRPMPRTPGHVRFRASMAPNPSSAGAIEMFDGAYAL